MKYIMLIVLLLVPVSVSGGWRLDVEQVVVEAPSEDYSDILFHFSAETAGTWENSAKPTGGDELTGTISGGLVQDTTNYIVGSASMHRVGNYDRVTYTVSAAHIEKEGGQIGFWARIDTDAVANNNLFYANDGTNTNELALKTGSATRLTANFKGNGSDTYFNIDYAYADEIWYFIVFEWELASSGDDLTVTVYDTSGTELVTNSAASITAMTNDVTRLDIGSISNAVGSFWIDNFFITNDESRDMLVLRDITDFN